MSIMHPQFEVVDRSNRSIRYLEHGWPTDLCRWHAHEEYELHLIVETRGKAFVGNFIGTFEPGSLFLTGPNLPHNWVTDSVSTEKIEIRDMLVQFSQKSFEKLAEGFPEFGGIRKMLDLAASGILFEGFNATFARGHMEAIRDNIGPERILAFIRFLVRLNEHAEKVTLSETKLVNADGNSKYARIGNIIDHILENFDDELNSVDAAEMAAMSLTTFGRNFSSVTGHSFVDFVNRVRIGQACGMLYASDDQVTSICFDVGFKNVANFNRHFLKIKGMTPSVYRETARKQLSDKMGPVL
ncbi:AraC family transcriptional regulator [Amylibacter sp.]|jgi:AraC-like DNA-binding protein|nr:AraC family transcriptional regulator [Amylibacter sp.]MDB9794795.1 AraC family transcriptional regulator [bacterium]MDA9178529.1 AraC family transcriptional regulator [Amylibacter sp.]MDA9229996.1 AraC family transcriptional regulator [Amylibacter sp.]MDA9294003.1 AraC family transcriptional regulator [Amylibacter sp.]|tara:strand:- start:743 stop:1636 length:894 start_codon:yes stop_codon:yes gene_type:complete